MLRHFILCALCVSLVAPSVADAEGFVRRDRFEIPIFPMDANTFEVIESDGAGGTQMWCAAGIYAHDALGLQDGSIYVLQGRGESRAVTGRKSVVFTTQPVEGAFSSLSQGVRRTGKVFSIGHASALCHETPWLKIQVQASGL
jgi:hypothetical protein